MIRQAAPLIGILFLAAVPFLTGQEKDKKAPKDTKAPDYYPLQVGNVWQYRVVIDGKISKSTKRIDKIDSVAGEQFARIELTSAKQTEHLSQSDKGVFRRRFNDEAVNPPFCLLKYPAKVGEKWSGDFAVGSEPGKHPYSGEIEKEEDVVVPAGKFKAIRVQIKHAEKDQVIKTTYWFAADVGLVKQTFDPTGTSITLELEKFERKK